MGFLEYKEDYKTFVVHRTTGLGLMESPREDHEVVGDFDTEKEAKAFGKSKYPRDPSGWSYNGYTINVNTATKEGKKLYKEFSKHFDTAIAKMKKRGIKPQKLGDIECYMDEPLFESHGVPKESHRVVFLDLTHTKDEEYFSGVDPYEITDDTKGS